MKLLSQFFFFAFLLFLASCGGDEIIEPSAEVTFGIRHDRTLEQYEAIAASSDPSRPDFAPVVAFEYSLDGSNNKEYVASGVLIDDDWILTAGHNFYDAQDQSSAAPLAGIDVLVGNDPNNPQGVYSVAEIVYHPTWLAGFQELADANDLCLVRLSSPVTGIPPASLYSTTNENIGGQVWHCGFGDYSMLAGQNSDLLSKKHAMENILDRAQGGFQTSTGGNNYPGGLLAFDFDHPDGSLNTLGDAIINADEAELGNGSSDATALNFEGTTTAGDSGGPLFLNNNGNWQVVGILSGGASAPIDGHIDGNYGDISIYIRVSSAMGWIQSVVQ